MQEGDAVNLIADLKLEDGRWQATCSYSEGVLSLKNRGTNSLAVTLCMISCMHGSML